MIRGIEKRDIVLDDREHLDFVERLSQLLLKTRTDCLAWCLLSKHAHILLRPTRGALSEMMQRLLTGYAVVFNLRHHRSGHLFQNRFKSIVCEEGSLVGGGLKRYLTYSGTNDHEAYDERVLGSGEFVEHIWHEANLFNDVAAPPPSLDEIIERVAALFGIEATTLPHGSKQKTISDARAALCYVAIRMFGYGVLTSQRDSDFPKLVSYLLRDEAKNSTSLAN